MLTLLFVLNFHSKFAINKYLKVIKLRWIQSQRDSFYVVFNNIDYSIVVDIY